MCQSSALCNDLAGATAGLNQRSLATENGASLHHSQVASLSGSEGSELRTKGHIIYLPADLGPLWNMQSVTSSGCQSIRGPRGPRAGS